jgi:hypothetical protein
MKQHADLMLRSLPEWDSRGLTNDMHYWFFGTRAMSLMGGKHWDGWRQAANEAISPSQQPEGHVRGSWDPKGPWGYVGGRAYSTALLTLALQELRDARAR